MLRFFYKTFYKYTNRSIINISTDTDYVDIDYVNIDSPDTINGHIIYQLKSGESLPTYILDLDSGRRWFVSGITQLRTGKFQISLLRDILSESDAWKTEEAYITAGLANDYNKYKRWDLPYTNTKIKEKRLNFNGQSSFFVFYVNENTGSGGAISENDLHIKAATIPGISSVDYTVSNLNEINNFEYVGAGNVNCWNNTKGILRTYMDAGVSSHDGLVPAINIPSLVTWTLDGGNLTYSTFNQNGNIDNYIKIRTWLQSVENNNNNCKENMKSAISNFTNTYKSNYGTSISTSKRDALMAYVDKYILNTGDSKVYTIRCTQSTVTESHDVSIAEASTLQTALSNCGFPLGGGISGTNYATHGSTYYKFNCTRTIYSFTLEQVGVAASIDMKFSANVRKLPRSGVRCVNIAAGNGFTDADIAQALMEAQANLGYDYDLNANTGKIVDIQYLPFTIATSVNSDIKINSTGLIAEFLDNDDFSYVTSMTDLTNINKETDTIKIVSPSRASQFLYRPYDNDGVMTFFTKVTIKPFASIIYVRPTTTGLLLNNWDDKDCLIISEDFSLTQVTNQWVEYVRANKNYSNVFERQIQGREFERSWERRIESAQKEADEWTARNISAQKAQTYTGNLPLISGIAGAIGTAVADPQYMQAAQLDREYNEALYQEGIALARDSFNMQIENIQSQPTLPSKITAIDVKFLDGIYLEFYSTNSTELNAINNFYRFNGNRVDAYGTFNQYYGWFIRGKLLRSTQYTQPEFEEVNRRLSMGIFTEVDYDQ